MALIEPPPTDRPSLLVLRALGLGDFLAGVPALRALRRAYPEHEIVLAAPTALQPLAELSGAVDRLLPTRGLEPLPWSGPPPDLAVNLHGRGPQSHRLLQALAPRRLVAFGSRDASHAGPPWPSGEHEVRRWCGVLEQSLGIPADAADLRLPRPRAAPAVPGAVVVHPGAAYPSRRWPADRFAAVARWAVARGHEVVVTGGPDEVGLAEQVRRTAGLPCAAVLAGRTDLEALAAQVAGASLLVSGDTGAAHLASAFATPSVVLFGPVSPALWGPPGSGPHRVLWHGDGTGDPWAEEVDAALLKTSVAEVLAAAEALLPAGPPSDARASEGPVCAGGLPSGPPAASGR